MWKAFLMKFSQSFLELLKKFSKSFSELLKKLEFPFSFALIQRSKVSLHSLVWKRICGFFGCLIFLAHHHYYGKLLLWVRFYAMNKFVLINSSLSKIESLSSDLNFKFLLLPINLHGNDDDKSHHPSIIATCNKVDIIILPKYLLLSSLHHSNMKEAPRTQVLLLQLYVTPCR